MSFQELQGGEGAAQRIRSYRESDPTEMADGRRKGRTHGEVKACEGTVKAFTVPNGPSSPADPFPNPNRGQSGPVAARMLVIMLAGLGSPQAGRALPSPPCPAPILAAEKSPSVHAAYSHKQ